MSSDPVTDAGHETVDGSDEPDDGMRHLSVRVPDSLYQEIDQVWEDRGFASRSEFLRQIIREGVYPPATLSREALQAIASSQEDIEEGKTVSLDDL